MRGCPVFQPFGGLFPGERDLRTIPADSDLSKPVAIRNTISIHRIFSAIVLARGLC